jgi:hypothetical protein
MAGYQYWAGELLMSDWQSELDELFKQNAAFLKSLALKIEDHPRSPSRAVVGPATPPPAAKSHSSEREEIMKRVASFKAHQQRAIRERKEYAASVLVKLKATPSAQC